MTNKDYEQLNKKASPPSKSYINIPYAFLIGGIICGIAGVKRIVFGPTGLTSIAIFIDPDNGMNFVFALIGVAATFAATFVITYALVRKDRSILKEIGQ